MDTETTKPAATDSLIRTAAMTDRRLPGCLKAVCDSCADAEPCLAGLGTERVIDDGAARHQNRVVGDVHDGARQRAEVVVQPPAQVGIGGASWCSQDGNRTLDDVLLAGGA